MIGRAEQRFGMSGGKAAVDEHRFDRFGKRQQAQCVRDRGTSLSHALRHFVLREIVLVDQRRKTGGFFQRIKVFALQVLDDRDFEAVAIVGTPYDGRNRRFWPRA